MSQNNQINDIPSKQMMRNKTFVLFIFFSFFIMGIFVFSYLQNMFRGTTLILGVDLYPRWIGSLSILNGESPYSLETRQQIWQAVYRSIETPTGNPFGFYYPPVVATMFTPLILIGVSLEMAAVIWCAFLFSFWAAYLFYEVMAVPAHRKLDLFLIPLLFISGLFYRPAFSNYILGQFALFSVLLFLVAWRLLKKDKPVLAGILIALSLIKFSLTLLPIALIFVFYFKNLRLWLFTLITLIILYLPPTILIGWWVPDFLKDISQYAVENMVSWSAGDILSLTGIIWLLLGGSLFVIGWRKKDQELLLACAFAFNALFVPHTADYDLVVFIGLLVWLGNRLLKSGRWKWLRLLVFLLLIWFPWISLIIFSQSGSPEPIVGWYNFIWRSYPILLLIAVIIPLVLPAGYVSRILNSHENA